MPSGLPPSETMSNGMPKRSLSAHVTARSASRTSKGIVRSLARAGAAASASPQASAAIVQRIFMAATIQSTGNESLIAGSVGRTEEAAIDFRILGPLEVADNGSVLALGRGRRRALLGMLLLRANEVVAQDTLVDALWGESPPPTALTALHGQVSRLRRLLGDDRLQTRPPGYLLRVGHEELDLHRFQRLLAQERYEEALALWRGPPLSDLAFERSRRARSRGSRSCGWPRWNGGSSASSPRAGTSRWPGGSRPRSASTRCASASRPS